MKVLQINTVYKNGGSTGRIAYDLKTLSEEMGIDAYVAYGYQIGDVHDDNTIMLQSALRRKVNILRTRIGARHGFYNEYETRKLISYMEKVKPDVIHLHNIHNHYVNVEMLFDYIKQHDIPVVWTLHDCWSFTGWCAYFDYANCDRWKSGCGSCKCKGDYPYTWFFDRSADNFKRKQQCFGGVKNMTIVTPSQWLADLAGLSFLSQYPIKVINNGVDTEVFRPITSNAKQELGIEGKKMILAMAMSLGRRKGIDHLLKLRGMISDDERLVLVGVSKEAAQNIATDRCICLQKTSNVSKLVELYAAADVFINPTLEDNFPTTNIEALACGTPVVTFKTGGSVESVDDTTGAVVAKGDTDALLAAIRSIYNRGKGFYQEACRNKAVRLYNKDTQYGLYIDLYKSVLKK